MKTQRTPTDVETALRRVLDYLWDDEAAHCLEASPLEASPLEGRDEHIFHDLVTIRTWLDEQHQDVAVSNQGRSAS